MKQVPEMSTICRRVKVPPCRAMISALMGSPSPVPLRPLVERLGFPIAYRFDTRNRAVGLDESEARNSLTNAVMSFQTMWETF